MEKELTPLQILNALIMLSVLVVLTTIIFGNRNMISELNNKVDSMQIVETPEESEPAMVPTEVTYNITVEKMIVVQGSPTNTVSEEKIFKETSLDPDDKNLIAIITMAEAEGESELGQRLVIDTILNRLDSDRFPNTIHDIVYAPGQFACVSNGRANRCYVKPELYSLVEQECKDRTNEEVIFFRTGYYHGCGEPLLAEGHHYFSKIK